jgi:5'-nucleotidase
MKRIAIDMDGVLADTYPHFIHFEEQYSGQRKQLEDLMGVPEFEAFPFAKTYLQKAGFFRTAPLVPHSVEAVKSLNEKYEVFIVSSATEFPPSLSEKQAWLNEHFPFISWRQMVFCGSKTIVAADIMIDDHFKNLDFFSGKTYLFHQPHNALANPGRHQRVQGWEELLQLLL